MVAFLMNKCTAHTRAGSVLMNKLKKKPSAWRSATLPRFRETLNMVKKFALSERTHTH